MIRRKGLRRYTGTELRAAASFVGPALVVLGAFILAPVIGTIVTSLYRDITYLGKEFVFLGNYIALVHDLRFWQSLRFTLVFIAVSVPLEVGLGLIFALLLNRTIPFRGALRAAVLIPWAIPAAISGRIWQLIYNYNFGFANYIIEKVGISSEPINWLGTGPGAFFALVIADAWKTAPFAAIILLAGLQGIPEVLHRQAQIDRAGMFRRFFSITLPLLKPALVIALLFRTIDGLRIFDIIFVLTNGGPGGATNSLSIYGYKYLLSGDFGYSSTISVALFVVAFVLSLLYARAARFSEAIR